MTYNIRKISKTEINIVVEKKGRVTTYSYDPTTHRVKINNGEFTITKK